MPEVDSAYQFLDLIAYGESHDDLRYPQLNADRTGEFVREAGDGTRIRTFAVHSLCIAPLKSRTTLLAMSDVRLQCWLTDTRLVVVDRTWSRAGVRVGGGMSFVAATARADESGAPSHARPEGRYGAAMHVRLPWLTHLGVQCRARWLHQELVRLVIKVDGDHYRIDLVPTRRASAATIANDILDRTVRLWTTWELPDGAALGFEERTKFDALRGRILSPIPRAPLEIAAFPCNAPVTQFASQAFLRAGSRQPAI